MRNELNELEQIENYLLGKMSEAENNAFEMEMVSNPELKAEVKKQQLLMGGITRNALKESIRSSGKKYFFKKKLFKFGFAIAGLMAAALLALFIHGNTDEAKANKPFINPPLKGINIPYSEYTIDPTNPSNIICPSGSIIRIPKNAFLDKNGKPLDHPVRLRYREFRDPADIFIAGIPMNYDSAGEHFHFESAGMFELQGFEGDKPVSIDPAKPITVQLASLSSEDGFNQYYLDTVKRAWEFICSDEPFTREEIKNDSLFRAFPLVPIASDPSKDWISIEADSTEFPELCVYKGVKFEVSDETKNFNPRWANSDWDKATVKRMDDSKYMITFEKGKEKHEIITYPVLDSMDREKAIKEFKLKTLQYNSLLKQKENKGQSAEKTLEQQLLLLDSTRVLQDKRVALEQENAAATGQIMFRVFSISRFGIYNSDRPSILPRGAKCWAKFSDDNNNPLIFEQVYLIEKGRNALFAYSKKNFSAFSFNPNARNMIWAITAEGKLAVCSEEEFAQAKGDSNSRVFKMHVANQSPGNEKEVKQILGY